MWYVRRKDSEWELLLFFLPFPHGYYTPPVTQRAQPLTTSQRSQILFGLHPDRRRMGHTRSLPAFLAPMEDARLATPEESLPFSALFYARRIRRRWSVIYDPRCLAFLTLSLSCCLL